VHPHWRTVVERAEDVRRMLQGSEVRICLDTGHLMLGGSDPLAIAREFAHRVAHVHLKDVDAQVADRLRSGELELITAVQAGLFQPLGAGGVPVDQLVVSLESAGYSGWYVLEQDTAIMDTIPPPGEGPIDDVRRSIEFLHTVAQQSARTEGG
jgi:inosose dehydratase